MISLFNSKRLFRDPVPPGAKYTGEHSLRLRCVPGNLLPVRNYFRSLNTALPTLSLHGVKVHMQVPAGESAKLPPPRATGDLCEDTAHNAVKNKSDGHSEIKN